MFEFNLQKQLQDNFFINVKFQVERGEITTLIGKSGAGKSSVLNLISGLVPLDKGFIRNNTTDYIHTPIHLRGFGYIQQQSYLFKHLTIYENITYSGKKQGVEEYLELFDLTPHLHKPVDKLSGGEAQRVSIVRTLMSKPKLLLIDEGFNAIDFQLRYKLISYLKKLDDLPIIYVTHDLAEAYELSDKIIVINEGKVIEKGDCEKIFYNCSKIKTAKLLGVENIYPADSFKEFFECPKNCCWVGIKGNQVYLEKEGYKATVKSIFYSLNHVTLNLKLQGLNQLMVAVLSRREYKPWEGKSIVYININHILFLEE